MTPTRRGQLFVFRRVFSGVFSLAFCLCLAAGTAHAGDPYLQWRTVRSPHFRVHFSVGLEAIAQQVAVVAEDAQLRLTQRLKWTPSSPTHILIIDPSDAANGSATSVPYAQVKLRVTAPDDMSTIGDYENWIGLLVTHEQAHVLHTDNMSGVPAIVNAVLGRTYAPNMAQPRFVLEGFAVALESQLSSAGRIRSSLFDMYLRADVLEDRLAPLDQLSHLPRRWPGGNLAYLYGGRFFNFISETYGPQSLAVIAHDYGNNIIPWGINRSLRRATGRSYPQLFEAWKRKLRRQYRAQRKRILNRGLRAGTRLTFHGGEAGSPRFAPAEVRRGSSLELWYWRADLDQPAGIYRLPLGPAAAKNSGELIVRTNGNSSFSFEPDGSAVFDSVMPSRRRYQFSDLLRQPFGTSSPQGLSSSIERLTHGHRARDPDVSPDGRQIAYVTNHQGTSTLRIAQLGAGGNMHSERRLVPTPRFEQTFTPRFSPDGHSLVYGAWLRGGWRAIRRVDLRSGTLTELYRGRGMHLQPSWSPDGKYVVFSSDRSGVGNIYAIEVATSELHQVTNVVSGAYSPELSPDGRQLIYVGYTSFGFDLFAMAFEPSRFLAPESPQVRPQPRALLPHAAYPVTPYSAFETLRPRSYSIEYGPGNFGQTATFRTNGSDIAGLHNFHVTVATAEDIATPAASVSYSYRRLPFDYQATLYRSFVPRSGAGFAPNESFNESLIGVTNALSYAWPAPYVSQRVSLGYSVTRYESDIPLGSEVDPFLLPAGRFEGLLGSLRLRYGFDFHQGSVQAISPERHLSVSVAGDFASEATGSDRSLASLSGAFATHWVMPWLPHHVVALAGAGGTAAGSYPGRGYYSVGGFVDMDWVEAYDTGIRQRTFVLRGYEPGAFAGRNFVVYKAEYRFPIATIDRGVDTLPLFLRGFNGTFFADYGGAWTTRDPDDFLAPYHGSVGAELAVDLVFGYFSPIQAQAGYAYGLDGDAIAGGQTYVVLGSKF
ncbi:MAG: PD40 domain-containing protein [Polyangiaceae bacterium]|nr:PD40 domain-containing protein [Polyangiaceae bacterium]